MKRKECSKNLMLALLTALIFSTSPALAKSITFQREYTYQASEADSKLSCRTIALEQVKRLLLEELGTYLEAETEVKDYQLTKDQITTLTAGIVQTEIVDEKWDGKEYWLQARIVADPDQVAKSIETLRRDRQKIAKLERVRKESEELLKENERLRNELTLARVGINPKKLREYDNNINKLSAREWYRTGLALEEVGDIQSALEAYNEGIKLDPKNEWIYTQRSIAHVGLGKEQMKKGNRNKALEHSQNAVNDSNKAVELAEDNRLLEVHIVIRANAYISLGSAYGALKKHDKATKYYLKAISDSNRAIVTFPHAQGYYNRGVAHVALKNYRQGFRDFNKAIQLDPEWDESYIFRSYAYFLYVTRNNDPDSQVNVKDWKEYPSVEATKLFMSKKYTEAIDIVNEAIEIDPNDAYAYSLRGDIYRALKKYYQAFEDINKAIELNPKSTDAYFHRGLLYNELDNLQQSIKDYTKCIEIDKLMVSFFLSGYSIEMQKSMIHYNIGLSYKILGNPPHEAIREFDKCIELTPTFASAYYQRGSLYSEVGNREQFLRDLKTAAKLGHKGSQSQLNSVGIQW